MIDQNEKNMVEAIKGLEKECRTLKEEIQESKNIIKKLLLKRSLKQKKEKLNSYKDTLIFIRNGYKED